MDSLKENELDMTSACGSGGINCDSAEVEEAYDSYLDEKKAKAEQLVLK